jgi:hypothetical protein
MALSARKIFVGLGIAGLVVVLALILVPRFLNPDYLQSLALEQIQRTFGPHVNVGQTTLTLFPRPHFTISDIVVKERADSHAVFRAQSMSLELGIGQLLQRKVVVREFMLDHPEIEIHRDSKGEWRFLGQTHGESPLPSLARFLVMGKLLIHNGKLIVIDESPTETVRGVVVESVTCETETSYKGNQVMATLELSGAIRQNREQAPFELSGQFEGVLQDMEQDVADGSGLFKRLNFSGSMVLLDLDVAQWSEFVPYGESLTAFPGTLDIRTRVKWAQDGPKAHWRLTDLHLASQAMSLAGNINVEELDDGHHMMGISLRSSSLDLTGIRQYVPLPLLPEKIKPIWERESWGGQLEIEEVRITGSSREDVGTSISGLFRINEGFFDWPGWGLTTGIMGTVMVEPDRIQVKEAHGLYETIPVDVTQGVVLLKESGPLADVEIQGLVPVGRILAVLNTLPATRQAVRFLDDWEFKEGGGILRLRFAGKADEPDGFRFQLGEYHLQDAVLQIPDLPQPVRRGEGKILFSRESLSMDHLQGVYGRYPLSLSGTISYRTEARFENVKFTGMVEGGELLVMAGPGFSGPEKMIQGPLGFSLAVSGPTARPKFKGTVDAGPAAIRIPQVFYKEAGRDGTLEVEGHVQRNGSLRLERMEFQVLPLRFRSQGVLQFRPTLAFDGRFDSGPIYLGLLPEGVHLLSEYLQTGILEVQLGIRGRGRDWKAWQSKGWVALTEGVATIQGIRHPLTDLFVRLKIDRNRLDLKRAEFHIHDSEAVVTGIVDHWMDTPAVSLMVESPRFDLDLLIPKTEQSIVRQGVEWLAAHATLQGSVHVARPRYHSLNGEKLSAAVRVHDNLISVDKVQMLVDEHGTLNGRFFIHLPEGKPAAMRASFHLKDWPFEKMLALLGDERRIVSGRLSAKGMIQGHGRDSRGLIPSLNGNLETTVVNGYIRQGTVVPRILALLNLPTVLKGKEDFETTGFPFERVTTTLAIEDGTFSTKDFFLNSPIMKMTAAGSYDVAVDRLDGVAAVSPFGAYSDLLKQIPLFGRIFAGDRKGIATAMFSVMGPMNDPKVTYLPGESFKTGVTGLAQLAFDILKNTVTLPYDLLAPSADERDPSGTRSDRPGKAGSP